MPNTTKHQAAPATAASATASSVSNMAAVPTIAEPDSTLTASPEGSLVVLAAGEILALLRVWWTRHSG